LVAAVDDHVMRTLLQPQMLTAEVPGRVHQFDRVERAAAIPWRHGGMCRFAVEEVLHRDQALWREALPVLCGE